MYPYSAFIVPSWGFFGGFSRAINQTDFGMEWLHINFISSLVFSNGVAHFLVPKDISCCLTTTTATYACVSSMCENVLWVCITQLVHCACDYGTLQRTTETSMHFLLWTFNFRLGNMAQKNYGSHKRVSPLRTPPPPHTHRKQGTCSCRVPEQ